MTTGKKTIRIQYVRSKICTPKKHKLVVKGLGFTRLNQIIEREDTPSIRGMIAKFRTWCKKSNELGNWVI